MSRLFFLSDIEWNTALNYVRHLEKMAQLMPRLLHFLQAAVALQIITIVTAQWHVVIAPMVLIILCTEIIIEQRMKEREFYYLFLTAELATIHANWNAYYDRYKGNARGRAAGYN